MINTLEILIRSLLRDKAEKEKPSLNLTEGCTVRLENGDEHVIHRRDQGYKAYPWGSKIKNLKGFWVWTKEGKYSDQGMHPEFDIKEVIARPEEKPVCASCFMGLKPKCDCDLEEKPKFRLYDGARVKLRNGDEDVLRRNTLWCEKFQWEGTRHPFSFMNDGRLFPWREDKYDIVEVLPPRVGDTIEMEHELYKIINEDEHCYRIEHCRKGGMIFVQRKQHVIENIHRIIDMQQPKPTYDLKPGMVVELRDESHVELMQATNPNEWYCKFIRNTHDHSQDRGIYLWDKFGIEKRGWKNRDIIRIVSEPEELKLEVGEFYKTDTGNKAICQFRDSSGIELGYYFMAIIGKDESFFVDENGKNTCCDDDEYIVGRWEE